MSISVIIPVYNAAPYLRRCLDSVMSQTFDDFELILVNDGSTDDSGKICDTYAAENDNIRVIHQENQGVSAARQKGLDTAKGDYITFADPDDWVDPEMLEEMLLKAQQENADVVISDFWINNEIEVYYKAQPLRSIESQTVFRQLLIGELHGSTCNKLYRRLMIQEGDITFPRTVNYCEDLWFNCEILMECKPKIAYLNKAFYHYDTHVNKNSLSQKVKRSTLDDYKKFISFAINYLSSDSHDEDIAYQLKYNYKRHAFRSDCGTKYYYSIYPELQAEFIKSLKSSSVPRVYRNTELLGLYGYLSLGRNMIHLYEKFLLPIWVKIKRIKMNSSI